MSNPGQQYDDFVTCAACGARRPLKACVWVHYTKPDSEGRAGEYRCPPSDKAWCESTREFLKAQRGEA